MSVFRIYHYNRWLCFNPDDIFTWNHFNSNLIFSLLNGTNNMYQMLRIKRHYLFSKDSIPNNKFYWALKYFLCYHKQILTKNTVWWTVNYYFVQSYMHAFTPSFKKNSLSSNHLPGILKCYNEPLCCVPEKNQLWQLLLKLFAEIIIMLTFN